MRVLYDRTLLHLHNAQIEGRGLERDLQNHVVWILTIASILKQQVKMEIHNLYGCRVTLSRIRLRRLKRCVTSLGKRDLKPASLVNHTLLQIICVLYDSYEAG